MVEFIFLLKQFDYDLLKIHVYVTHYSTFFDAIVALNLSLFIFEIVQLVIYCLSIYEYIHYIHTHTFI